MATTTMTAPGTSRGILQGGKAAVMGALERLKGRMGEAREELKNKDLAIAQAEGLIQQMASRVPKVMGPMLTTGATIGTAYAAGYAQELLDEKKAGKIGPVDAVPALGLVLAAVGAIFIKDPDVAAGVVSVGAGAAAGGAGEAGRQKRKEHKQALDAKKAAAPKA